MEDAGEPLVDDGPEDGGEEGEEAEAAAEHRQADPPTALETPENLG